MSHSQSSLQHIPVAIAEPALASCYLGGLMIEPLNFLRPGEIWSGHLGDLAASQEAHR
jgi:hypothetical protein